MNQLFDREEMIRLSREGMENAMKFYMTLNENVMKVTDWQKEAFNETTKRNIEMVNKAYDEYQKNTRVIMSRIENVWRNLMDQTVTDKAKTQDQK